MLRKTDRNILAVLMTFLAGCNLEVGNPDGEPSSGLRQGQTVSFNLQVGDACTTTSASCNSVPVSLPPSSDFRLTYDMTGATFQLSSLQLKPLPAEQVISRLDLLNGASVLLGNSAGAIDVSSVAMQFSSGDNNSFTFGLSGNLLVSGNTGSFTMPLNLEYPDIVSAEAQVANGLGAIVSIQFDPRVWFDFSDAPQETKMILKALSGGACHKPDAPQCAKFRDHLALNLSQRISKSMSVLSKEKNKKE